MTSDTALRGLAAGQRSGLLLAPIHVRLELVVDPLSSDSELEDIVVRPPPEKED